MKLKKCKHCGGDPVMDYDAVSELGASGCFQNGWVECSENGNTKHCLNSVLITFDADDYGVSRDTQLITMWNILND